MGGRHETTNKALLMSTHSLFFDGGAYIDCGNVLDIDNTAPLSISYWYCPLAATGDRATIAKIDAGAGWWIDHNSDATLYFQIQNTFITDCLYVYASFTNISSYYTWRHYVITYDGSQSAAGVKIYVDGVSQTINTTYNTLVSSSSNAVNMTIGRRMSASFPNYINGYLDDVAIWEGTELAQSDVDELYNNFDPPVDLTAITTPPTSWWKMGDDVVSWPTIPDSGPDGYAGTASGTFATTDIIEQMHIGGISLPAEVVHLETIAGTTTTTYYKMIGRDSSCPTPTYHSWVVTGSPDFAAASAGTLPCGGPLVDIYIGDQWTE